MNVDALNHNYLLFNSFPANSDASNLHTTISAHLKKVHKVALKAAKAPREDHSNNAPHRVLDDDDERTNRTLKSLVKPGNF